MKDTDVQSYYLYEQDPNVAIAVHMGRGEHRTYFPSIENARKSNCHGIYENRTKYKIGIVRIVTTYTVVQEDVDPPSAKERVGDEKEIKFWQRVDARVAEIEKTRKDNGDPCDVVEGMLLPIDVAFNLRLIEMMDEIKELNAQTED